MQDESFEVGDYVIPGKVCVVVRTKDGKPPVQGAKSMSTAHVGIGKIQALAVFTDDDLADRYAEATQLQNGSVVTFPDPVEFGKFLVAQADNGTKYVALDPLTLSPRPPVVFPIANIIKSIHAIKKKK